MSDDLNDALASLKNELDTLSSDTAEEVAVEATPVEEKVEMLEETPTENVPSTNVDIMGALGIQTPDAGNALAAVMDVSDGSGFEPVFPTVIQDGRAGGMEAVRGTPQDLADMLPSGKRAVYGVILTYRMLVTAWPVGFEEKGGEGDKKARPAWSAAIPSFMPDQFGLATEATKRYQFTKKNKKGERFDWKDGDGVGHCRPQLELLVYLPDIDGLAIIQTASHYTSLTNTVSELNANVPDGKFQPFPCSIRPHSSEPQDINGYSVSHHWYKLGVNATDAKLVDAAKAFKEWFERTRTSDSETVKKITDWANCEDAPITDDITKALTTAKNYPQRG